MLTSSTGSVIPCWSERRTKIKILLIQLLSYKKKKNKKKQKKKHNFSTPTKNCVFPKHKFNTSNNFRFVFSKRVNYIDTPEFIVKLHLIYSIFKINTLPQNDQNN